jgi:hypothetical protein
MRSDSEETNTAFTVRSSGNIGREIVDADGVVVCWTVDPWLAQVIARLLESSDREGLFDSPSAPLHQGEAGPGIVPDN